MGEHIIWVKCHDVYTIMISFIHRECAYLTHTPCLSALFWQPSTLHFFTTAPCLGNQKLIRWQAAYKRKRGKGVSIHHLSAKPVMRQYYFTLDCTTRITPKPTLSLLTLIHVPPFFARLLHPSTLHTLCFLAPCRQQTPIDWEIRIMSF